VKDPLMVKMKDSCISGKVSVQHRRVQLRQTAFMSIGGHNSVSVEPVRTDRRFFSTLLNKLGRFPKFHQVALVLKLNIRRQRF